MRAFLFGLILVLSATPVFAQTTEVKDDEPPHIWHSATENIVTKMVTKLGRGFVNCLTFLVEIPKQMVLTGREQGFWTAISLGLAKGIGMAIVRLGAGLWEIAFFLSPWPDDYKPILDPEYVWE